MDLLKDKIPKLVRKLAVPAMVGTLFQTLYNVVDTFFAGKISPEALSALSKSFPIYFIIVGTCIGVTVASTSLIANSIGESNEEKTLNYFTHSIYFGIINYLKKIKKNKSLWKGECYVFDNRISLTHGLTTGTHSMCSGCRKPISIKDKKSLKYEEGVSCPNCHDTLTNSQKERFRMRQKQINVAKKLGRKHIFQKEF